VLITKSILDQRKFFHKIIKLKPAFGVLQEQEPVPPTTLNE
jgi:hypothetical protein